MSLLATCMNSPANGASCRAISLERRVKLGRRCRRYALASERAPVQQPPQGRSWPIRAAARHRPAARHAPQRTAGCSAWPHCLFPAHVWRLSWRLQNPLKPFLQKETRCRLVFIYQNGGHKNAKKKHRMKLISVYRRYVLNLTRNSPKYLE